MLVLVHTVPLLLAEFDRLGSVLLPGVTLKHILDEPLLERVRVRGRLAPEDAERLQSHIDLAAQIGAQAVLVTCSSVSPCVDAIRTKASPPVVKIDDAMLAEAVHLGIRIGIVATNPTTLEPTERSLLARAASCGKTVELEVTLVEGALTALLQGDSGTHDRLVSQAVLKLAGRVDVVALAQASMARALDVIPEGTCRVPVLSSPHLALAQIRALMQPPIKVDEHR
jgi:Asp/Glu/hydantoin racemase